MSGNGKLRPNERSRFYMRLGKSRRDRKLAAFISADVAKGVNVSKLMKELLYNYYTGVPLPVYESAPQPKDGDEARQTALSAKLRSLSFDALKAQ